MKSLRAWFAALVALALVSLSLASISCEGDRGPTGPQGEQGESGPQGPEWDGGTISGTVTFNGNTTFNDTVAFTPGITVNFCGAAIKMCGSETTIDLTDATITGLDCSWEGGTVAAPASFDDDVTFKDIVDFMEGTTVDFTGATVTGLAATWDGGSVTGPATFEDDVIFEKDVAFSVATNVDFSGAYVTGLSAEWEGGIVPQPTRFVSGVEFDGDVDFDDDHYVDFHDAEIKGLNELNEYLRINSHVDIQGEFSILQSNGQKGAHFLNRGDLVLGGNGLEGDLFIRDGSNNTVMELDSYANLIMNDPSGDARIEMDWSGVRRILLDSDSQCEIENDLDLGSDLFVSQNLGVGTHSPQRDVHVVHYMRLEPTPYAPSNPAKGDMYMSAATNKLMVYDGTTWQACW